MDLWPSDISPKSVVFNTDTHQSDHILITQEQLTFHSDGSHTVRLLGIKNDTSRSGMEVTIPPGDVVKLDPIQSLKEYVAKMASVVYLTMQC